MFARSFVLLALVSSILAAPVSRRQAGLDLGSCSDPTIIFADGLDGRKEPAFAPSNDADFNHGSALKIGVISDFICQRLQDSCKASQDAIDSCQSGSQAAKQLEGQASADAFNAALSGGAAGTGTGAQNGNQNQNENQGEDQTGSQNQNQNADQNSNQDQNTDQNSGDDSNNAGANDDGSQQQQGGNLQTFTGDLGGTAPPVTPGGKGFVTNGSDFLNVGAALGRSCDVQHNACANAANSGQGNFSVADCDTQNNDCRAAAN